MRVLHVAPSLSVKCGGPTQHILGLARVLQERGIESVIATTTALLPGKVQTGHRIDWEGVPTYFFHHQTPPMYAFSWQLTRWLRQNVRDFDVVHTHTVFSYAVSAAQFFARKFDVPYVISPSGTLDRYPLSKKGLRKRLYLRLLEYRLLRDASAFIVTSLLEHSNVGALNLQVPLEMVPIGVPKHGYIDFEGVEHFKLKHDLHGCFTALSLSRLDPIKGLEQLIQAAAQLRSCDKFRIVIVGSGAARYEQKLRRTVDDLKLKPIIKFVGPLYGMKKVCALAASDVFVLPSYHENFGVAVAEAMEFGIPVLISNEVGLASTVRKSSSGLVVGCDPHEIASGLLRLMSDAPLRQSMGDNGRRVASREFDWTSVGKKVNDIYLMVRRNHAIELPISAY